MKRAAFLGFCLLAAACAPAQADWNTCATDAAKDAVISCTELLKQFPGKGVFWATALRNRGRAHYELTDYEAAIRDYSELLASDFALAEDYAGRADALGWLERWADSLKDAEEALRRDPTNPLYKWSVALALHQLDQHAKAVEMLIPLKDVYPGDDAVLSKLGWSLYKLGRYDEALATYEEVVKAAPQRVDYWTEKGFVEDAAGRFADAERSLSKALELSPGDAYALFRRAGVRNMLGRYDEALADARKAVDIDPQEMYVLRRASTLINTGKFADAEADLDRFAKSSEYKSDKAYLRGRLMARQGKDEDALPHFAEALKLEPDFADASYDAAMSLWNLGRLEEAERNFTTALLTWTNDALTLYRRGGVRLERENYDGALADTDAAIAADPQYALAYEQRAIVYHRKMLYVKAEADCREALAINPALSGARLYCAWSAWSADGFERAIADYDLLLKSRPDDVLLIGERAELLYDLGRLDESRSEAERAVKLEPSSSPALRHRGSIYERDRKYEAAFRDYNRAIGLAPDDGWALEARAYWLLDSDQVAKGLADCRAMIEKLPNSPASYRCLARASWEADEPQDAYEALKKALALNENYGPGYFDRGILLMQEGRFEEARDDFSRAIALSHRKADALIHRGDAYDDLGDRLQALRDYKAAAAIARGGLVQVAKRRIAKAEGLDTPEDDPSASYPGRHRSH